MAFTTPADTARAAAEGDALHRLDAGHLKQALQVLRDVSAAVDEGRTWTAVRDALAAAPTSGVNVRLATIERDLVRLLSIVTNPAPSATYLGDGLVFLPTSLGLPLIGFADDLQITPSILMQRKWDERTTQLLERIIKPGDCFLDIGANIGYFTVFGAALAGGTGHVHAFEPNPRTHHVLTRNVRLNRFSHVCTLHQSALGDRTGTATIHTFVRNQCGSTLSSLPDHLLEEWYERPVDCTVPLTTLDAVFADRDEVFSCIKMDAEGSEAMIWAGGARFFREHVNDRTIIMLEWNPPALAGAGADPRALIATFANHGFSVWRRDDRLALTRITDAVQLDDRCNCELLLARDPARVVEVCP
jgi:FkbM family methyltransferase